MILAKGHKGLFRGRVLSVFGLMLVSMKQRVLGDRPPKSHSGKLQIDTASLKSAAGSSPIMPFLGNWAR